MEVRRLTAIVRADIKEQNEAREAIGLPLLVIKTRTCIRCGSRFESTGARTCGCPPQLGGENEYIPGEW